MVINMLGLSWFHWFSFDIGSDKTYKCGGRTMRERGVVRTTSEGVEL